MEPMPRRLLPEREADRGAHVSSHHVGKDAER